jgi:hypothetical protein
MLATAFTALVGGRVPVQLTTKGGGTERPFGVNFVPALSQGEQQTSRSNVSDSYPMSRPRSGSRKTKALQIPESRRRPVLSRFGRRGWTKDGNATDIP